MELWAWTNDIGSGSNVFFSQDPSGDGAGWGTTQGEVTLAEGKLDLYYGSSYPPTQVRSDSAVLTDKAWHHVAYTRDGGTFRIYGDGVQVK